MATSALSLLLAPPAHAQSGPPGSYSGPVTTGGIASKSGTTPANYFPNPQTGYYGDNVNGTGLSCTGQIETKWTWTPRVAGTPPPQQVIIKQLSNATWESTTVSGQCADGLTNPTDPPVTTSSNGDTHSTSGGTHYSLVQADSKGNVTVDCTPSASVSSGSCGVYYQPTLVSPVTISLSSAIQDSSGNLNILVGQGCTASLSGTNGCTVSNWQWSVSGTTFQDWEPTTPAFPNANPPTQANPNASYYSSGSGPLTNATAHWYWNDPTKTTETVICTARGRSF